MRLFWCSQCWSLRLLPEDIAKLPGIVSCVIRLNPEDRDHGPMKEIDIRTLSSNVYMKVKS